MANNQCDDLAVSFAAVMWWAAVWLANPELTAPFPAKLLGGNDGYCFATKKVQKATVR